MCNCNLTNLPLNLPINVFELRTPQNAAPISYSQLLILKLNLMTPMTPQYLSSSSSSSKTKKIILTANGIITPYETLIVIIWGVHNERNIVILNYQKNIKIRATQDMVLARVSSRNIFRILGPGKCLKIINLATARSLIWLLHNGGKEKWEFGGLEGWLAGPRRGLKKLLRNYRKWVKKTGDPSPPHKRTKVKQQKQLKLDPKPLGFPTRH